MKMLELRLDARQLMSLSTTSDVDGATTSTTQENCSISGCCTQTTCTWTGCYTNHSNPCC